MRPVGLFFRCSSTFPHVLGRGSKGKVFQGRILEPKVQTFSGFSSFPNVFHIIYLEKNNNGGVSLSGEKMYFYL